MRTKDSDSTDEKESVSAHESDAGQGRSMSTEELGPVVSVHRTIGNQAVQRLHQNENTGARLAVSAPTDEHEREAEQVAESVLAATPSSRVSALGENEDIADAVGSAGSFGSVPDVQRQDADAEQAEQTDVGAAGGTDTDRGSDTDTGGVATDAEGVLIDAGGRRVSDVDQVVDEAVGIGPWWPGYTGDDDSGVPEAEIDQLVSEEIDSLLDEYQNINVSVYGPLAAILGWGTVTVDPVYYINSGGGRDIDVEAAETTSEIESTGGTERTSVEAVEAGKATPADIKMVVQRAISQGVVRDHVGLSEDEVLEPEHVQQWVEDQEVGVDCSGLVVAALIRSTEALIEEYGDSDEFDPVTEPERRTRGAAHLVTQGLNEDWPGSDEVTGPTDLRPGDMWYLPADDLTGSDENHIRIVHSVERLDEDDEDGPAYEFETAESASSMGGPTENTWRTAGHENFHPITHVDGNAPVVGSFYRSDVLQDQSEDEGDSNE